MDMTPHEGLKALAVGKLADSDDRERAFQFIVNALGAKRRWLCTWWTKCSGWSTENVELGNVIPAFLGGRGALLDQRLTK